MYAGPQRRPPSAGRTFLEREGQPRWRSRRCTSRWCSPRGSCGRTEANRCASEPRPREACASLRGVDIFGGDSRAASRADDPRILRATRDSLTLTSPSCRFLPRRCTCADLSPTGWKRFQWPPSPPPRAPRFSRWCATCPPGTTSINLSSTGSGATTRIRRSSRILSATSTTGAPAARPDRGAIRAAPVPVVSLTCSVKNNLASSFPPEDRSPA